MITIRHSTFETNSSSTHSITMCTDSDFNRWKKGELFFCGDDGKFYDEAGRYDKIRKLILKSKIKYNYNEENGSITDYIYKGVTVSFSKMEELMTKENLDEIKDDEIMAFIDEEKGFTTIPLSYDDYWDTIEFETYEENFTTPKGEKIVAFGYYGEDR